MIKEYSSKISPSFKIASMHSGCKGELGFLYHLMYVSLFVYLDVFVSVCVYVFVCLCLYVCVCFVFLTSAIVHKEFGHDVSKETRNFSTMEDQKSIHGTLPSLDFDQIKLKKQK